MARFTHPAKKEITLSGVMAALGDPVRLLIMKNLVNAKKSLSYSEASPYEDLAKSTLSNHFRILREAGLIRTAKIGVENHNVVRWDELEDKFPGLLENVIRFADDSVI